jgi:hypothetical protein
VIYVFFLPIDSDCFAVGQDEATRKAAAEAKGAANTAIKPIAPASGTGTDNDPEEGVKPSSPADLRLKFQQTRGDASFRNCLAIRVNNGSLFSLGCNHDGDLTKELSVPTLSSLPSIRSGSCFRPTVHNAEQLKTKAPTSCSE